MRTALIAVATALVMAGFVVVRAGGVSALAGGGADSYAFLDHQPNRPDAPVTYSSCKPVRVELNLEGVDDKETARSALEEAGVEMLSGRGLNFRDPWGNYVQVVGYEDIQFTKAPEVLRGMRLELGKSEQALNELREKGMHR